MTRIAVFTLLLITCTNTLAAQAQDTERMTAPLLDVNQRRQLAMKFLAPIKDAAIANPKSEERHNVTDLFVHIDPQWTAKFILDNPLPASAPLYDAGAVSVLMERLDEVDHDVLLEILERHTHAYFLFAHASKIISKTPKDSALHQKIVELANQRKGEAKNIKSLGDLKSFAVTTENRKLVEWTDSEIAKYFRSGKAQKTLKAIANNEHAGKSYVDFERARMARYAPDDMKAEFSKNANQENKTQHDAGLQVVLLSAHFTDEEKLDVLHSIGRYTFGAQAEDYMNDAGYLASVAKLDPQLALKWANEAPHGGRIWAKIVIAPSIAKTDRATAIKLIKEAYQEIEAIDSSDRFMQNYNYPAPSIASAGLPIVEFVDPTLLDGCIDQTLSAARKISNFRMSTAKQHIFKAVAAVARYDMEKATELFNEFSDDVRLDSSAEFFRAMVAVDPENVWEEYQQIPDKDDRGISRQYRIRLAILPALSQKDDKQFWEMLSGNNLLAYDKSILK